MQIHDYYYEAKPYIPWKLRMLARRLYLSRRMKNSADIWPIDETAGRKPDGWPGWPEGKKFAFVLTHDVEGEHGLAKCERLMQLEKDLGFRSCFNFIPEGEYTVSDELRATLAANDFEVGVHDLYHDGKLYRSREGFARNAVQINKYLDAWGAVGFRSGFMHHNLEWLHDLNVAYDSSTFDTDPFEPMPDGVGTIFPFWVTASDVVGRVTPHGASALDGPAPNISALNCQLSALDAAPVPPYPRTTALPSALPGTDSPPHGSTASPSVSDPNISAFDFLSRDCGDQLSGLDGSGPNISTFSFQLSAFNRGYLELPYTLPQDSTMFFLLKEKNIDIWKKKLDWIASKGGMALLNVHPDYMHFDGTERRDSHYPASLYSDFLKWVSDKYAGQYYQTTPKEVAAHFQKARIQHPGCNGALKSMATNLKTKPRVWIDLDNTPHVPFFAPIIEELELRGYECLVTARDAFQVRDLAKTMGVQCKMVGKHSGKNRFRKVTGLFYRALQLMPSAVNKRPVLSISHGSRSQIIASNLLHIPTLLLADYEFAKYPPLMRPTYEMVPEVIPSDGLYCPQERVRKYPGIKEDVYAWRLNPDKSMLENLGIRNGELVVTVRPPATEAHYHNPESEKLFTAFMNRVSTVNSLRVVLLPRNKKQGEAIRNQCPAWFENARTIIPSTALDGLSLVWHSDLVVSGGGTMNREAAALGVPVYSIFRGPIGAVDRHLAKEGKLILIESVDDVEKKILLTRREKKSVGEVTTRAALLKIVSTIEELAKSNN